MPHVGFFSCQSLFALQLDSPGVHVQCKSTPSVNMCKNRLHFFLAWNHFFLAWISRPKKSNGPDFFLAWIAFFWPGVLLSFGVELFFGLDGLFFGLRYLPRFLNPSLCRDPCRLRGSAIELSERPAVSTLYALGPPWWCSRRAERCRKTCHGSWSRISVA